jgi:hypothetical protein
MTISSPPPHSSAPDANGRRSRESDCSRARPAAARSGRSLPAFHRRPVVRTNPAHRRDRQRHRRLVPPRLAAGSNPLAFRPRSTGELELQALLTIDLDAATIDILRWFISHWQVDVTFQETRAHLGARPRFGGPISPSCAPRSPRSDSSPSLSPTRSSIRGDAADS